MTAAGAGAVPTWVEDLRALAREGGFLVLTPAPAPGRAEAGEAVFSTLVQLDGDVVTTLRADRVADIADLPPAEALAAEAAVLAMAEAHMAEVEARLAALSGQARAASGLVARILLFGPLSVGALGGGGGAVAAALDAGIAAPSLGGAVGLLGGVAALLRRPIRRRVMPVALRLAARRWLAAPPPGPGTGRG